MFPSSYQEEGLGVEFKDDQVFTEKQTYGFKQYSHSYPQLFYATMSAIYAA